MKKGAGIHETPKAHSNGFLALQAGGMFWCAGRFASPVRPAKMQNHKRWFMSIFLLVSCFCGILIYVVLVRFNASMPRVCMSLSKHARCKLSFMLGCLSLPCPTGDTPLVFATKPSKAASLLYTCVLLGQINFFVSLFVLSNLAALRNTQTRLPCFTGANICAQWIGYTTQREIWPKAKAQLQVSRSG